MRGRSLKCVYQLAKQDPRIVFIGSDLGPEVLKDFKSEMPERFFMEGISEAHIIGMAAGLAKEGYIPYVNTIATFLTRRCYEQIAIDLCLQNLPVRLIANGGGLVYAPLGPTHLAIEDIGLMRLLPNMTILVPADAEEIARLMMQTVDVPGPIYIRVAKGGEPIVSRPEQACKIGRAIVLQEPGEVVIVTMGVMVHRALQVSELLKAQSISCGVVNMHTVKPLDPETLFSVAEKAKLLVILEEHTKIGGLGSAVMEAFVEHHQAIPKMLHFGIPDCFAENYGSQDRLINLYGMDAKLISVVIKNKFKMSVIPG